VLAIYLKDGTQGIKKNLVPVLKRKGWTNDLNRGVEKQKFSNVDTRRRRIL